MKLLLTNNSQKGMPPTIIWRFFLWGVFTLQASSQTLPCHLTGGTSCPTMICPNTAVNYTCNVGSYAGNTVWNVPSVGVCSGTTLILAQAPPAQGLSCLTSSSSGTCGPFTVTNTPPLTSNVYCLTSTLSVVVTSAMNGLVVSCSSYSPISFITTPVGNATISVVAPPPAPNITSLISTNSKQLTVTWTSVLTATSYNVSINDSVNTLVPIPSTGAPQYTFTGLTNNTVYTVSVVAINCAGNATMTTRTKQFDVILSSPCNPPTVPTATNIRNTTNVRTLQPSTSSSYAVAIAVGVVVGFVVLLLVVAIAAVVVVILVTKKGSPATPKGDYYEQNKIPLPPKNTDKAPSKPEGLIYADIGLPSRVPMQAPNPRDLSYVTYSTVGTVSSVKELL